MTATGVMTSTWVVDLSFRDSAVPQVEAVSTRLFHNHEQQLAITVDGVVLSAPSTRGVLGQVIEISAGEPPFSERDAVSLAGALNTGALPLALSVGTPAR